MKPDAHDNQAKPIRVLLVDDDPTYREGLRQLLGFAKDLTVVGEASSAEEAFAAGRQLHPHVVVIDAELPRAACVEMMRSFTARPDDLVDQQPSFICLAVYPDQHDAAIQAGAARFLRKDASPRELVEAIRAAAHSGPLFKLGDCQSAAPESGAQIA
jgi:DNA-binding NarL/FixJ family response regulator